MLEANTNLLYNLFANNEYHNVLNKKNTRNLERKPKGKNWLL